MVMNWPAPNRTPELQYRMFSTICAIGRKRRRGRPRGSVG
jgi:hypothetical protein